MTIKEEITKRQEFYLRHRGELAYGRLQLTRKLDEYDKALATCEAAIEVNAAALKDLDTEAAIEAAKAQEVKPNE